MLDRFFNIYDYYFDSVFEFIFGINPEAPEGVQLMIIIMLVCGVVYVGSSILVNILTDRKQQTTTQLKVSYNEVKIEQRATFFCCSIFIP